MTLVAFAIVILIISGTQLALLAMVVDILRKLETNQRRPSIRDRESNRRGSEA
jgi:hypothetical protein